LAKGGSTEGHFCIPAYRQAGKSACSDSYRNGAKKWTLSYIVTSQEKRCQRKFGLTFCTLLSRRKVNNPASGFLFKLDAK
jgi:hypothetical protein